MAEYCHAWVSSSKGRLKNFVNVVGVDGEEATVMVDSLPPCWIFAFWKAVAIGQDGNAAHRRMMKV